MLYSPLLNNSLYLFAFTVECLLHDTSWFSLFLSSIQMGTLVYSLSERVQHMKLEFFHCYSFRCIKRNGYPWRLCWSYRRWIRICNLCTCFRRRLVHIWHSCMSTRHGGMRNIANDKHWMWEVLWWKICIQQNKRIVNGWRCSCKNNNTSSIKREFYRAWRGRPHKSRFVELCIVNNATKFSKCWRFDNTNVSIFD